MMVKEVIPLGEIGFDHKFHGKLLFPWEVIWKILSEVNVTTRKVQSTGD